jgi:transketolase
MRPTIRLAALMGIEPIFVFTHDSVGLGEDGPTHQPVEHLAALRAIPNVVLLRPADANETAAAWKIAMQHRGGPAVLVFSRQDTPTFEPDGVEEGVKRGAYILSDCQGEPQALLMATGTEVALALKAQEELAAEGIRTRVISMPSFELFEQQDQAYRERVLPSAITARVAIEAGSKQSWYQYLGTRGIFIGVDGRFGASAPAEVIYEKLGITPAAIIQAVKKLI